MTANCMCGCHAQNPPRMCEHCWPIVTLLRDTLQLVTRGRVTLSPAPLGQEIKERIEHVLSHTSVEHP